jgi:hypothetical protein
MLPYVDSVLKGLSEHTGLSFTLFAGGPVPALNGELQVFQYVFNFVFTPSDSSCFPSSIHRGKTIGADPVDFGAFGSDVITSHLIPKYIEFLRVKYCM